MPHLIFLLIFFLLAPAAGYSYEKREDIITSGQINILLDTNEIVFEHLDEESHFILSREYSYNQVIFSQNGTLFKYIVSYLYNTRDYPFWVSVELPEIGEWKVAKYTTGDVPTDKPPVVRLECKLYRDGLIIQHDLSLWPEEQYIRENGNTYALYGWSMWHRGNRSSLENPCHIRFAKKRLLEREQRDARIRIFLVRDTQTITQRCNNCLDDLYISIHGSVEKNSFFDISTFIVPRIYFIKLETDTFFFYRDYSRDLYFTVIVQRPLSADGKKWDYHRMEIIKEYAADFITINDLGPIPRSEWEPDWPDPATTPLWVKEPEE